MEPETKIKISIITLSSLLIFTIAFSSITHLTTQSEIDGLKQHNIRLVNELSELYQAQIKNLADLAKLSYNVIPFDESWTYLKTDQATDSTGKSIDLFIDGYTNGTNYGAILRFPSLNFTSPMYRADDM
ncbi:MAG: hypothetical protein WC325_11095 [Candidatus Bathyarchaeia archaeon]|jgi:hypothetical protein